MPMNDLSENSNTQLYAAIGAMIVHWSYVEEIINDFVLLLYHKCDGKNTKTCRKSGMPRSQFGRKLTFLEEIIATPPLVKYQNELSPFISMARQFCEHRDIIIHGVTMQLKPNSLKISRYKYNNEDKITNKPHLELSEYTVDNLIQCRKIFEALATELAVRFQIVAFGLDS